ncbi:Receptor-like protein kinase HSL1 [Linum grandiflorum]
MSWPTSFSSPSHHMLTVLFTLFIFCFCHGSSQLLQDDREILLRMKQHWQNPLPLSHWSSAPSPDSSPCDWPEVNCSGNSVTVLNFDSLNISGTVPPFICDLKNLTFLDLYNNSIVGGFPTVLYNCSNLEYLNLGQNYFVGPIPGDVDRLGRLNHLDVSGNNFSSDIPSAIGRLKELRVLYLNQNQFNGTFPQEIGSLSKLEELALAYNGFMPSLLHSNFTQLKNLKVLWVSDANLIGEIPEMIGEMESLEFVDLSTNKLNGSIPAGLFKLKKLSVVYLYKNRLSGDIPRVVEALELTILDVSDNSLSGTIPDDFGKLQKAQILNLFYNNLGGEIPESIGQLPQLTEFSVYTNNLSGPIPADFGRYSMLEVLQVDTNRLTGKLPEHLCSNRKLDGISAYDNFLSGELPKSLGNCSSLRIILISNNSFSGEVPAGLWTGSNLTTLTISDNSLTGELPNNVAWNLSRLEISNNRFTGTLPRGVGNWTNLVFFSASNNSISGSIPPELTALPLLANLLLDGNQLTGALPSNIISWQSLATLNLRRNQLSGNIPPEFGNLPRLSELDLSENQLSGTIPSQMGSLPLTVLNVSSNRLTGNIPRQFQNGAYADSFLNNAGLCSSNSGLNLNSCNNNNPGGSSSQSKAAATHILALVLSVSAVVFVVAMISSFLVIRKLKNKRVKDPAWEFTSFQKLNFTEEKILAGLTESNVIGMGGSGKVYRISVNGTPNTAVAVKRIWNKESDDKEFLAEVQTLSGIRHTNIVKLLCCISNNDDSKLLVYEYLENRSLDLWLHSSNKSLSELNKRVGLDWPKRLNIAIGSAEGLCYMHHDCVPPVIHRDVKSSNILLDSQFNPKIADFGLARMLNRLGEDATLSTVAGSFGYMAPEYGNSGRVNEKVDVYSFGVVLLELTTGRDAGNGGKKKNTGLVEWAWHHVEKGKAIGDALDEEVKEGCFLEEMVCVFKLGILCTSRLPDRRPSMKEVVQILDRCRREGTWRRKSSNGGRRVDESPLLRHSDDDCSSLPV